MRAKIIALVAVVALAASVVVVAAAQTSAQDRNPLARIPIAQETLKRASANGLPAYTDGWQKWPKINRKPFRDRGPLSSAHSGLKNVYASKRKVGSKYPNGTVIVKTIVKPGTSYIGQFAVMRKVNGRWRFVEFHRSSATARYRLLAQGQLCVDCHVEAKSNDYVFTKR